MSAFTAALAAAWAHELGKPARTAPVADRVEWLFAYSDLLHAVADAADSGPEASRQARVMAHQATSDACRLALEAVS